MPPRLSKWFFPTSLVPPWCLAGCPRDPFLNLPGYPSDLRAVDVAFQWLLAASRAVRIQPCLGRLLESPGLARLLEASGLRPDRTQPCLGRLLESPGFALADYWNGYCQNAPNQMPTIISVISASIANFWIIWPWDFPLDSAPCLDFNQAKCFCFNWLLPNCPQPKA